MIDVDEDELRQHSRVFVLSAILAGYGALLLVGRAGLGDKVAKGLHDRDPQREAGA